jgi:hypothetical protein
MADRKKTAAKGRRVTVEWGSIKKKVGGKTSNVKVYSKVIDSVFKACGLKEANIKPPAIKKDKKGRQRLAGQGITRSGARYLLVHVGEKTKTKAGGTIDKYHRVPIPPGVSMAKASAILKKGKAVKIKFPNARPVELKAAKK